MRRLFPIVLAFVAAMAAGPAAASLQPQMYCWGGDSEFPVACEYEGGDDEMRGIVWRRSAWT